MTPSATNEPQGLCPKSWVARVDGAALRTRAGGVKRFGTEDAALKAARKEIKQLGESK